MKARPRTSAGLLMFRRRAGGIEVLLAHPGGPFFRNKDEGSWTIPKGEAGEGEDLRVRAQLEFQEEIGCAAPADGWIDLGWIQQKGGKIVHAWGVEGDLPNDFEPFSNTFELEWPPRSGQRQAFPEVDRVGFFGTEEAARKIKPTQRELLERLASALEH
jgi:predicted NUDIX family NTP pyrophosphohydrolase